MKNKTVAYLDTMWPLNWTTLGQCEKLLNSGLLARNASLSLLGSTLHFCKVYLSILKSVRLCCYRGACMGSLIITQVGFCCVYLLFVAQNLEDFFEQAKLPLRAWEALLLILLIPYVFVKNLKYLAPFSAFANLLTAVGLVIIVQYCVQVTLVTLANCYCVCVCVCVCFVCLQRHIYFWFW